MALPKKKSRRITVDDTVYRWMISGNDYGIDAYVELADEPGQLLRHIYKYSYDDQGTFQPITSDEIAALIKRALSCGWRPGQRGSNFELNEGVPLQ